MILSTVLLTAAFALCQPQQESADLPETLRIDVARYAGGEEAFDEVIPDLVFIRIDPAIASYMDIEWETTEPFWMMETELSNVQAAALLGFGTYREFASARYTKARSDIGTHHTSIDRVAKLLERPNAPYIGVSLDDAYQIRTGAYLASFEYVITVPTLSQWAVASAASTDHAIWCKDLPKPPDTLAWGPDHGIHVMGSSLAESIADVASAGMSPNGLVGTIGNVAEFVVLTENERDRVTKEMSFYGDARFGRFPVIGAGGTVLAGSTVVSSVFFQSVRDVNPSFEEPKNPKPKKWDRFIGSCSHYLNPVASTNSSIGSYANDESSLIGLRLVVLSFIPDEDESE